MQPARPHGYRYGRADPDDDLADDEFDCDDGGGNAAYPEPDST